MAHIHEILSGAFNLNRYNSLDEGLRLEQF